MPIAEPPYEHMRYVYLEWSLILLAIWAGAYLARPAFRQKMLAVSGWTSLLGLSEPFFVPRYWTPPTLLDLAARTGFDVESLIFAFAAGGLASTLYDELTGRATVPMSLTARHARRHRLHEWALAAPLPVFFGLGVLTPLNPIYVTEAALAAGALATVACRPDLWRRTLLGAGIFLALYFLYFVSLVSVHPTYVRQVWNLHALSGVLIAGIPLEELLFAVTLGSMWAALYEHWSWRREVRRPSRA